MEKLTAGQVRKRYPHVPPKALYSARYNGAINATEDPDLPGTSKYRYHIDRDFELWQSKYLDVEGEATPESQRESAQAKPLPGPIQDLAEAFEAVRSAHQALTLAIYDGSAAGARERMRRAVTKARRRITQVEDLLDAVASIAGIEPADIMGLPAGDGADVQVQSAHADAEEV